MYFSSLIAAAAGILLILLICGVGIVRRWRKEKEGYVRNTAAPQVNTGPANTVIKRCPICSSQLAPGEQVKTVMFDEKNEHGARVVHVKGCVHCLEGLVPRYCPVCSELLSQHEVVIARFYEKNAFSGRNDKAHIHVVGCSKCVHT
ncbi:MAG: hypothetical protein LBM77_10210 [Spirochaetaceae bacterium]|jgi:hypothetical protein|nr:hypothetical protein [Spirochaetaceae bacterium]